MVLTSSQCLMDKVYIINVVFVIARSCSSHVSPQPDTSLCRETIDMGLMCRMGCLFTPQLLLAVVMRTHGRMATD